MATRTAQVIIQVDDKSLVELNAEIKTLETSIKNLKIGTQEWVTQNEKLGTLKTRFKEVTETAKQLQGQVAKISGPEQLRSIAKLGAGMVGAFSAATGSLKLLGINSEAFDEMTAKATTLMSVMGGLNQLAETFSAQNMKGLKQIAGGFTNLIGVVKGFSTATKAALISTGIGALLVLLGLVIANWDKIKVAVGGVKEAEKEKFDESQKQGRLIIEGLDAQNKVIEDQIKLLEERNKYKPNIMNEELIKKNIELQNASLREQLKIKEDLLKKNSKDVIETENAIKKRKQWEFNNKENNPFYDFVQVYQKARNDPGPAAFWSGLSGLIKLMPDIYGTIEYYQTRGIKLTNEQLVSQKTINDLTQLEIDNLKAQLKLNEEILDRRTLIFEQQKIYLQSAKDLQAKAENELIILNSKKNTEQEIFENERSILYQQVIRLEKLKSEGERLEMIATETTGIYHNQTLLTIEEQQQLDKLYAQIEALENQRELRLFELKQLEEKNKRELQSIIEQTKLNELIYSAKMMYLDISTNIDAYTKSLENASNILNMDVDSITAMDEKYQKILKTKQDLADLDKKARQILTINNDELTTYLEQNKENIKNVEEEIAFRLRGKRINEDILKQKSAELFILKDINDKTIAKLEKDKEILANNQKSIEFKIKEREDAIAILKIQKESAANAIQQAQADLQKTKPSKFVSKADAEQKRLELLKLIEEKTKAIQDLDISIAENSGEIVKSKEDIVAIDTKILSTNEEINTVSADTVEKTKEATAEVENQSRAYQGLQKWVQNYAEEIDMATKALTQSLEFVSALFERNAAKHQEDIDILQSQYDEMNAKEQDRKDRLLRYEEELKDANGDRYDELLRLIDEEKAAKDINFISEEDQKKKLAELERKKLIDERKAAIWRKTQSMIEGIVQTALAVIKALPNVFLSVAAGIAGAAAVATIAAQKIPDLPPVESKLEGGYTRKGKDDEVAGIVHKNEYVVPAKVNRSASAQHHIAALERMRTRGYQDGGFVTPNNVPSIPGFEYDKLVSAMTDAFKQLPPNQVSLVAVSNGLAEVQYTKSNAGLTR